MSNKVSERIKYSDRQFDVLGDVLETLRFRGNIFFNSKLAAPWGMSLENVKTPRFHIALEGDFIIGSDVKGNEETQVNHMGIALIPNGDMHWIADKSNRQLIPSEDAGAACKLGTPLFQQGKFTHQLICGIAQYDEIIHPILDSLPPILHFSNFKINDPVWMTVMLIDAEMKAKAERQTAVVDRLTEVLFIQLLNKYAFENEDVTGFFSALHNKRVYRVLELIHQGIQTQWTLDLLGQQAGMSRATLIRQFNAVIGIPPMTYITNWRMARAFQLIKYSSNTLEDIAEQIGFSSARTLNKAFQRHYQFTPYELRKI